MWLPMLSLLLQAKTVVRVEGHQDDVNAVAYADEACKVIFSGSDDCLVKVSGLGGAVQGLLERCWAKLSPTVALLSCSNTCLS